MDCQLCKKELKFPIKLNCSHKLCLTCAESISICESDPLVKAKYNIKCPKCAKLTRTFHIHNLLVVE